LINLVQKSQQPASSNASGARKNIDATDHVDQLSGSADRENTGLLLE